VEGAVNVSLVWEVVKDGRRHDERVGASRGKLLGAVDMASSPCVRLLALAALGMQACHDGESVVIPPPVDAAFASLSAGLLHTCGVTVTDHLYCWGWNRDGEVGDGSQSDRVFPMRVSDRLSFRTVSAGGGHSCAVTTAGVPYCWGLNLTGQLGDGSTTSRLTPTTVVGKWLLAGVASGGTFTCGISSADSSGHCWGWGRYGQLGSRPAETCATETGSEPCSPTPIAVSGGLRFLAINAGTRHTCALAPDSTAYCWGRNDTGQLGNGTSADTAQPVVVAGGVKFKAVTLGFSHSCGLTAAGDAYCWGDNTWGQLGDTTRSQSPIPVRVVGGVVFLSLSAGAEHTCGIGTGTTAWCWGQNLSSELGAESPETCTTQSITGPCSRRPLRVTTSQSFGLVAAGAHHSCGIATTGRAYCWGNNSNGQLGTGNHSGSNVPVLVANQP